MKKIQEIKVLHIVSEPGDATRYDYIVARNGPDEFVFMPFGSTFSYPQRVNYYDVKNANGDYTTLAERSRCNVYTYAECARTVLELKESTHA